MKKTKPKQKNKNNNTKFVELIKQQADRINELREENANLLIALEGYRLKEKQISDLVDYAKKQSEDLKNEAKVKYALECERIKLYRQKWTTIINSKKGDTLSLNYEKTLSTLKECQKEMEEMLANDLGENMKDYLSERNRIDDEPILNYQAIINKSSKVDLETLTNEEIQDLLNQL